MFCGLLQCDTDASSVLVNNPTNAQPEDVSVEVGEKMEKCIVIELRGGITMNLYCICLSPRHLKSICREIQNSFHANENTKVMFFLLESKMCKLSSNIIKKQYVFT